MSALRVLRRDPFTRAAMWWLIVGVGASTLLELREAYS